MTRDLLSLAFITVFITGMIGIADVVSGVVLHAHSAIPAGELDQEPR